MATVRITASFDPEEEEADSADDTGLTEEAFTALLDALMSAGLYDITILGTAS